EKLDEAGYGRDVLQNLQRLIEAENSDLYDVLEYVSSTKKPITREARVAEAQSSIFYGLDDKQKEFIEFVLSKYVETGVEELDQDKLPNLLELKYYSLADAVEQLGGVSKIQSTFIAFQKHLYQRKTA
ncbi:MAG: restriction endonuclease subunit R, partial [Firmicutes bacterium]|nr:restriction endonuclease subunit R [Bacillota bacterium]